MDTDTWWHLRAGQWILEHRAILGQDVFSYTRAGAEWHYPGWLIEVGMTAIYRLFGPAGLNLWTALMVTLAFVFVWFTMEGDPFLRAFVLIIAAASTGVYWAARPYMITFLLTAVYLWILEDFRWRRKDRLWLLPLLMIGWVNCHGGFTAGFLVWGAYLVGTFSGLRVQNGLLTLSFPQETRRLLVAGLLTLAAVCINPFGPEMLLYSFRTISIEALKTYIQEWQSPDFHQMQVQPFLWLLFLTLGAVGASRKRLAAVDFFLVAGFAYMAMMAGRNVALFGLVAPMVLTRHLQPLMRQMSRLLKISFTPAASPTRRTTFLNCAVLLILALAVLAKLSMVVPLEANEQAFRKIVPVDAVNFLHETLPPGRLFNPYNWGGYLLWALPEYPVFVDGRTDLYNDQIISEWLKIVRTEPGWQQMLAQYDVHLVLTETGSGLEKALQHEAGWKQIYHDSLAGVYQK